MLGVHLLPPAFTGSESAGVFTRVLRISLSSITASQLFVTHRSPVDPRWRKSIQCRRIPDSLPSMRVLRKRRGCTQRCLKWIGLATKREHRIQIVRKDSMSNMPTPLPRRKPHQTLFSAASSLPMLDNFAAALTPSLTGLTLDQSSAILRGTAPDRTKCKLSCEQSTC